MSFFMVATMGLSNVSCTYLSYPTQVMFKSSKLIPVMIGGRFINGRRFTILEYSSALLLVCGLTIMTLNDVYITPEFHLTGIFLISGALVSDAFISNLQEKTLKDYNVTQREMVFFSHTVGALYLLVFQLLTNQLHSAMQFCASNPSVYLFMALFSIFGYVGITFVLAMLKLYDSFIAMTVTSCRKFLTIALSFMLFPKPITFETVVAVGIVFCGIGLHIYTKNPKMVHHHLQRLRILRRQVASEAQGHLSSIKIT